MKFLLTILIALMSFGFLMEKALVAFSSQDISMVLADETSSEETGEEQGSKSGEDLKEKLCSSVLTHHYSQDGDAILNITLHLHRFPSGFINKPYMPPEMI